MLADNATLNSGGHIFYDLAPLPVLDPIYLQTSHLLHHTSYFILQTHTSDVIFKTTYFRRHISDVIFQTSYYRRHTGQQPEQVQNTSYFEAQMLLIIRHQ